MTTAFLIVCFLVTAVICVAGLRTHERLLAHTLTVATAGVAAFGSAFAIQMVLYFVGLQVDVVEVVLEEICKVLSAALVFRIARPIAVVAVFAGVELIAGKFLLPYWMDASSVSDAIYTHGVFLAVVTTAVYGMHLATGQIYGALGLLRGFIPAVILHAIFNMLGGRAEETASVSMGFLLLSFSIVAVTGLAILTALRRTKVAATQGH